MKITKTSFYYTLNVVNVNRVLTAQESEMEYQLSKDLEKEVLPRNPDFTVLDVFDTPRLRKQMPEFLMSDEEIQAYKRVYALMRPMGENLMEIAQIFQSLYGRKIVEKENGSFGIESMN